MHSFLQTYGQECLQEWVQRQKDMDVGIDQTLEIMPWITPNNALKPSNVTRNL